MPSKAKRKEMMEEDECEELKSKSAKKQSLHHDEAGEKLATLHPVDTPGMDPTLSPAALRQLTGFLASARSIMLISFESQSFTNSEWESIWR